MVDKNLCIGCGMCASICPVNAITMEDGIAKIDYKKCIRCMRCVRVCPTEAIEIISKEKELELAASDPEKVYTD